MEIQNFSENEYGDIFGDGIQKNQEPVLNRTNFKAGSSQEADIFNTETTTLAVTETTTLDAVTETTTNEEVDILENGKKGRKPKYSFEDTSGYFEDRIKSGKFVAVEEEDDKGNKKLFIPKTPEEFDEVLDIQINYKVEEAKKNLEQSWLQSKSPAWQAVAKYAEMVDDPVEILPFIQGIRNYDSVSQLNENEIDEAERIVRIRLEQRGDTEELIDQQVEALKTTDKLVSTAKAYKPILLQEEQRNLQALMLRKQQEEQQYFSMVQEIEEKARKTLETPLFGKAKLKNEELQNVYDLIAYPTQETEGYGIYAEIDKLFDSRDFNTLAQIALLLKHKESFYNYITNNAVNATAANLQRKLRAVDDRQEGRNISDNNDDDETPRVTVSRNQYKPKFGRN